MKIGRKFKTNIIIPFVTMADIAFLLLIFLIVTSSVQKNPDIKLTLPESTQFDKIEKKISLELFISEENTIMMDDQIFNLKELKQFVKPGKQCVINADKQADFKLIYQIIQLLKENQYEKISFSVKRESTLQ